MPFGKNKTLFEDFLLYRLYWEQTLKESDSKVKMHFASLTEYTSATNHCKIFGDFFYVFHIFVCLSVC